MTTRRRQQPGSRAWRDRVEQIKRELARDGGWLFRALERQDDERVEERQAVIDRAESLRIEELLAYMNDNLLNGQGVIESSFYWEMSDDFDDEEDEDDEEEDDEEDEDEVLEFPVLSIALTWKQAARLRVNVELVRQEDDFLLRINDEEMAATARALQAGVLDAFEEQMSFLEEVDDDDDDE